MPYRRKTIHHGRPTPEIFPVLAAAVARAREETAARCAPEPGEHAPQNDERPRSTEPFYGRWWTRTTDLFLIREAL